MIASILLFIALQAPAITNQQQTPPEQEQGVTPSQLRLNPSVASSQEPQSVGQTRWWWPPPPLWDIWWPTVTLVIIAGIGTKIAWNTFDDLKRQTENAGIAAQAALKNAQAVINSERGWVLAELQWNIGYPRLDEVEREDGSEDFIAAFRLGCINQGKTPAWIKNVRACLQVVTQLPDDPDTNSLELIDPTERALPANGPPYHFEFGLNRTIKSGELEPGAMRMRIIWGIVEYTDIFEKWHRTVFGYSVGPDNRQLTRLIHPGYNRNE